MSDEILKVTNVSRVYETSGGGFGRKNKVSALDGVSFNLVQGVKYAHGQLVEQSSLSPLCMDAAVNQHWAESFHD